MRLRGEVTPPGDKSISHRALILGALGEGETRVRGLNRGADVASTASALRQLGVAVRGSDGDGVWVVVGRGGVLRSPGRDVDCGNSGTSMRLLTGLVAGLDGVSATFVGDDSLSRRPMERVAAPLRKLGAEIDPSGGHAPVRVTGRRLRGTRIETEVASAQVKSAVLLAAWSASGPTEVVEPSPSRDHTERMLRRMGADIEAITGGVRLTPGSPLAPLDIDVPADPSAAAFYAVAACLSPGSAVTVRNVGVNPTRSGFLDVLDRMGASIERLNPREVGGEPVADLHVTSARLKATAIEPAEIPSLVDEVPILAVAAAAADGRTTIRGAAELRVKESDRLGAMADGLGRLGVEVTETEDGLDIVGREVGNMGGSGVIDIDARDDHRVAMSFKVLGAATNADIRVRGESVSAVSDPGFHDALARLAAE